MNLVTTQTLAPVDRVLDRYRKPIVPNVITRALKELILAVAAVLLSLAAWNFACPTEDTAEQLLRRSPKKETLQYFATHRTGKERVLTDGGTGDWLILHQAGPVFIDTRFDFYGKKFFSEWVEYCLDAAPGWRSFLDKYEITHVLLTRGRSNLCAQLDKSPEWKIVKDDGNVCLWKRVVTTGAKNPEQPERAHLRH